MVLESCMWCKFFFDYLHHFWDQTFEGVCLRDPREIVGKNPTNTCNVWEEK